MSSFSKHFEGTELRVEDSVVYTEGGAYIYANGALHLNRAKTVELRDTLTEILGEDAPNPDAIHHHNGDETPSQVNYHVTVNVPDHDTVRRLVAEGIDQERRRRRG